MSQNIITKAAPPQNVATSSHANKMHELFLTTMILGRELDFYLRVMQGVCGMQPNHSFRRQVIFEGPRDRKLLGVPPPLIKQPNLARGKEWQSLHEPLSRQAYYLTAFWDIPVDQFGKRGADGSIVEGSGVLDLNQTPGTLRWGEWADSSNIRKMNSRQVIQIENEKNLLDAMRVMHHGLWAENVRESYQYVHDNVVVEFTRYFHLPGQTSNPIKQISHALPPREDLILYDEKGGEDKWVVTAYRLVFNGTDQDLMQEGVQEMKAFQELFKDSLDFEMMDRHDMDPRVR